MCESAAARRAAAICRRAPGDAAPPATVRAIPRAGRRPRHRARAFAPASYRRLETMESAAIVSPLFVTRYSPGSRRPAELAQDFLGMLAEQRRRPVVRQRR